MKLAMTIAPEFRPAAVFAAVQQGITGVLSAMMLDGGQLFQVWAFTVLAFWVGVVLIAVRRPISPTRTDILLIKWGFVPLFVIAGLLVYSVWRVRGVL